MNIDINLLRQNARSMVRELGLLNDAYFDIGVTLAERHLLIELAACLYPTVGEIAERLLLDKSTASRLIAKAVKKGYVKYASDEADKRKRFLQMTEKGKGVLQAFEEIAFNQTREALLTLTPEEAEAVLRGVALYAQGLKNARLKGKAVITAITPNDNPALAHLLAEDNLFEAYQPQGFSYFVMKSDARIVAGAGIAPSTSRKSCVLGKICMPDRQAELAKKLIGFCLQEGKKMGYRRCFADCAVFSREFFIDQGFEEDEDGKLVRNL